MVKFFIVGVSGLILGILIAYLIILQPFPLSFSSKNTTLFTNSTGQKRTHEVIGFLPYWLLNKAQSDYSPVITQLAYFALTVDTDGTIVKLTSPVEAEPGWYALNSGKFDDYSKNARNNNVSLALTVFNGNSDEINELVSDPENNAQTLAEEVIPVIKKHGFHELNLDLESTQEASDEARANFIRFTRELTVRLKKAGIPVTIDITGMDLIKHELIDPKEIGKIVDKVMVMTYDFHYAGSRVTGGVAPLKGAGVTAEYDVQTAIQKAKEIIDAKKIILGVPVYGYEWETLNESISSATIPGSGITASTQRVEKLLSTCSTCSAKFDPIMQESYVTYLDSETGTYHQIFFPTQDATQAKVDFALTEQLGGIGIWALGYESKEILFPLSNYIKSE